MPTATAAPAVTSYLRGNVDFVIAAVFLSNAIMAILWPIFFWLLFSLHIPFWHLLLPTSSIVIGPLVAARAFRLMFPQTTSSDAILQKVRSVSFLLWLGVVFLASAKASAFLRTGNDSLASILAVACLAGAFCAFQFWLGKKIGGKEFGLEVSQSLGQKNTIFALWACLQFFSPFIALGPIFYLLFHNLYNSYLLATAGREVKIPEKSP
jgi:BASS family bile acid:Na+ symporter